MALRVPVAGIGCALLAMSMLGPSRSSWAQELATLAAHTSGVVGGEFSPDGKLLATIGDAENAIMLWDMTKHELRTSLTHHTAPVWCVEFSPDGKLLASCGEDRTARIWDVQTAKLVRTLEGHAHFVTCCAFSPDGKLLATGENNPDDPTVAGEIRIWEVATGRLLSSYRGHGGGINSLVFTRDGKALTSFSDDRTIKLWSLPKVH